jgi:hypothetical protein
MVRSIAGSQCARLIVGLNGNKKSEEILYTSRPTFV